MLTYQYKFLSKYEQSVTSVSGNYVIKVNVQSYNNPTNRCESCLGGCCDRFFETTCNGPLRCDNQFTYCLRSHNTPATTGCCQGYTSTLRSAVNTDGGQIDYSQPTVLGLPNPLRLTGLTNSWQVSAPAHITTCVLTVLKSCMTTFLVAGKYSATQQLTQ